MENVIDNANKQLSMPLSSIIGRCEMRTPTLPSCIDDSMGGARVEKVKRGEMEDSEEMDISND